MVLNFERIPVGAQAVTVGGRVEDGDEQYYVRVVDRDKLVGRFVFSQVLKLVDHDIHSATSGFFVELFVEPQC